jgi:hypothetical protein
VSSSSAACSGDVSNIELIGREHHQVVESVAAEGPVVPLRLATIYPDDVTIRALLAERYGELAELLRSFRGAQEWGCGSTCSPGMTTPPRPWT